MNLKITVISEWKKFISLRHCTLIFQHSRHLRLHILSLVLSNFFIPSVKKVSGWLLLHLRTAGSTSASDKKIFELFNVCFSFGNSLKSDGAKCGLQKGCGTTVNFRLVMASWVSALQCGLALSWCKRNVFLSGLILRMCCLSDRK